MKLGSMFARLWRQFVSRHKREVFLLVPALALVAAGGVSYAFILKYVTDGLASGAREVMTIAPIAVLAATGVRAFAMWAQAILSQELALKCLRDLQGTMFRRLTGADFARFAREEPGKLVTRFTNDINVVSEAIVRGGQAMIRDTLTLAGALVSMFVLDWMLSLLALGVFALAGPALGGIARRARRQTEAAQAQIGALAATLIESFAGARFVKTYGLEAREQARAEAAFESRRKLARKLAYNRAGVVPLLELLGGAALAGILWVAAWRIGAGLMTLGDLTGMMAAVATATPAARALGQFNTLASEAGAALARIFGVIDEPREIVDKPNAAPLRIENGEIVFRGATLELGGLRVLDGVEFSVRRGESVALVGPSGAGKSSVFNLLARLYDASAGAVTIDGQDVRDVSLASLRAAIGLVSQDAVLFNDTIGANIALGRPGASPSEIEAAARAAAAHEFISVLPYGYDTPVGERGANLSGGERQRIAVARAFLRDAPILLLDEATSALDAASEAQVREAVERLARGRTVIAIAHRLTSVRTASRILTMEAGRIVEAGTHDELLARGGLYARLWRLQGEH